MSRFSLFFFSLYMKIIYGSTELTNLQSDVEFLANKVNKNDRIGINSNNDFNQDNSYNSIANVGGQSNEGI